MIASFLMAWLTMAHAGYSPLYGNLVDGRYQEFQRLALEEIQKEQPVAKKREILRVLAAHRARFYELSDFTGKILPFNNEDCLSGDGVTRVCSSERGFEFLLGQTNGSQTFSIRSRERILAAYRARSRTFLAAPESAFGKALHLILPKKTPSEFFLLIREIERSRGRPAEVHQTIHVFRVRSGSVCHLLESDVTVDNGVYQQIEEFVRSLGRLAPCLESPLSL